MKLHDRKPDIGNLLKVLRGGEPARPTLFELFMNRPLYERLAGWTLPRDTPPNSIEVTRLVVDAYAAAGFDYATTHGSGMHFQSRQQRRKDTISLNEGFVITDEASFESYEWPEPDSFDYTNLKKIEAFLPEGLKLMVMGPGGVLENTIALTGYDNLCYMLFEKPELAKAIFDRVGARILGYYDIATMFETVGVVMVNDDWGFKNQTFLSPKDMMKYVLPWHKRMVDLAHSRGLPAVLHSCGNLTEVMDAVIDYCGFDGKHSYEDIITPVEDAYEKWHGRIAILGGIDVDFVIKRSDAEITERCHAMLKRAEGRGGYALGTGNSVPEYIPQDKYIALLKAALE